MNPATDSGKLSETQISAGKFLVSRCNGPQLFDALEEALDLVVALVVASVKSGGNNPVGFGRDTGFESHFLEVSSKCTTVIGLVGKNGPRAGAVNELGSRCKVMGVARSERKTHCIPVSVNQGVSLGVRASSGGSNTLKTRRSRGSMGMLVHLTTCGVNRPEFAFSQSTQCIENVVP